MCFVGVISMWPVGVVAGCGHCGGALNHVISGQCVFKA